MLTLKKPDKDVVNFSLHGRYVDGVSEDHFNSHIKQMRKSKDKIVFWYGRPAWFKEVEAW